MPDTRCHKCWEFHDAIQLAGNAETSIEDHEPKDNPQGTTRAEKLRDLI